MSTYASLSLPQRFPGQTRPVLKFRSFSNTIHNWFNFEGFPHKCLVCIRYCTLVAAKTSFQRCGFQGWWFNFSILICCTEHACKLWPSWQACESKLILVLQTKKWDTDQIDINWITGMRGHSPAAVSPFELNSTCPLSESLAKEHASERGFKGVFSSKRLDFYVNFHVQPGLDPCRDGLISIFSLKRME